VKAGERKLEDAKKHFECGKKCKCIAVIIGLVVLIIIIIVIAISAKK
jgi:hypothetical protein